MPNNEFTFLYLGRLVEYKGADYLIRAFSKLEKTQKNAKLVIAGKGIFKDYLNCLIKDLDVKNVEFREVNTDSERFYYYTQCNVFVLPSVWRPDYCEAWGLVLNEAMQCGKAVITTDAVGAAPDLVKNGVNGFIVKNSDSESLYQAMRRLVENPELAKSMGANSKKIVTEHYTYEKMTKGFVDAINSTLER
jgi:glycosyltransferase involved in cell wall biosynthesis